MSDLIDRQALLEWFNNWSDYDEFSVRYIVGIIKEQPSAERKGHWVKKWHTVFKEELPCCSECNNFMAFRWGYCPNCGARMELE